MSWVKMVMVDAMGANAMMVGVNAGVSRDGEALATRAFVDAPLVSPIVAIMALALTDIAVKVTSIGTGVSLWL